MLNKTNPSTVLKAALPPPPPENGPINIVIFQAPFLDRKRGTMAVQQKLFRGNISMPKFIQHQLLVDKMKGCW